MLTVAELWARVADGVCAYTEMTAGEVYLGTAQDWTDMRRIVDLAGYRPAQRTAAHGWIRADTAPGASPLIPAGTQVQAPGTPEPSRADLRGRRRHAAARRLGRADGHRGAGARGADR